MIERVISADCHVTEPPSVFDRVPKSLRDRVPKVMTGADGGEGWSFDGKPPKRTLGVEAMAGQTNGKASGLRFDEILPGNFDGVAHAADMDRDGIDVSIVYPANVIHMYVETDRELAIACIRSYNDWLLDDFAAAAPGPVVSPATVGAAAGSKPTPLAAWVTAALALAVLLAAGGALTSPLRAPKTYSPEPGCMHCTKP